MIILRKRRNPWSVQTAPRAGSTGALAVEQEAHERDDPNPILGLTLYGQYVFDPAKSTYDDFRRFMWAGLVVLRDTARSSGLPESEVRQLLGQAFDEFDDASEAIWATLKKLIEQEAGEGRGAQEWEDTLPAIDPAAALEEAQPRPITVRRMRPLTLLNPNDEILSRFHD
jgi:hypothetical protein